MDSTNHTEEDRSRIEKERADDLFTVVSLLSAAEKGDSLKGTIYSLCNELASRFRCSRVSIGLLCEREIRIQAMSQNSTFSRQMEIVQDLEMVMEECFDQDKEVSFPCDDGTITRSAREFERKYGPVQLISLPLRDKEKPFAVMTLERVTVRGFSSREKRILRLLGELVGPRLHVLRLHDRWIGAKLKDSLKAGLKRIIGPQHTGAKLISIIFLVFMIYFFTARTDYTINAGATFLAEEQQIVSAPFSGFIRSVDKKPGDQVIADEDLLGQLDTTELELVQGALLAELIGHNKKVDQAVSTNNTVARQIASAEAKKVSEEIRLNKYRIEKARMFSSISGTLVSEDLNRMIGARVNLGEELFAVVPIEGIFVELNVSERDIADIESSLTGELVAFAYPDQKIPFEVERIYPVAILGEDGNSFKVKVILRERPEWIRPGMNGQAKVVIRTERIAWVWTRKFRNWLSMKLW